MRKLLVCVVFLFLLCGCAATQRVPIPDLNQRISDSNKARIYMIRPPQKWYGRDAKASILDGDMNIGILKYHSFLVWERDPGKLVIRAYRFPVDYTEPVPMTLDVQAGEVHYIGCPIVSGTFTCAPIPESQGINLLKEAKAP